MTATVASADIVQTVLAKKDVSLIDVLKAFNATLVSPEAEKETPLPKSPAVSAEVGVILRGLPGTLAGIGLPTTRRELSVEERTELTQVFEELQEALSGLKVSETQFKTAFQQHFDAHARAEGLIGPTTLRNKDGFAILRDDESAAVEGLDKKVVRQTTIPTPVLTNDALQLLEEAGILTHAEYLAATRPVREVREEGVLALVRERPELIAELAAVAVLPRAASNTVKLSPNR